MLDHPDSSLTICGIQELDGHAPLGATHVLSILDPDWPALRAFNSYADHHRLELRFHDVIEADFKGYTAPLSEDVERILAFGRELMQSPKPVRLLIHCHAGISRSTASAVLLLAQAEPTRSAADIVAEIVRIRDKAWPNLRMIEIGDRLLGRHGEIVAAVRARHRALALARPEVAEFMRAEGRHRELDGF
jgi:predicted protein tyrosine phosphatase